MRAVSNRRPSWRAALIAAAIATGASTANAQEGAPIAVAIDVVTSDACPASQFRSALGARVRRPLEIREDATTHLQVTLAATPDGAFEATASFRGASGGAARSVHGTCDDVTAALAIVAATWLEAEPSTTPTPVVAPPPPVATASPPPPRVDVPRETAPEPPRPRRRLWLGAQGIATFGTVGNPSGGAGIAIDYETPRLEARATVRGALASDTATGSTTTVHYAWLTAALDGCGHVFAGAPLRLAGCARIEPGYFHAQLGNVAYGLPWLSLGLVARLGVAAGPVRLEVEGDLGLPVTGYRVTRADTTVVPFRALAPGLAVGAMLPFL